MSEDNTYICGRISERKLDTRYFEWEIPDFFSRVEDSKIDSIVSPDFSFLDCNWRLELDAWCARKEGTIGFYIMKDSADSDKTLTYTSGVKKSDGTMEEGSPERARFTDTGDEWTIVLKLKDLKKRRSELAPSDTLTITCRMEPEVSKSEVVPQPQPLKFVELQTFSSNFKDLFINKKNCDFIIKVKDKEFKAHRTILMARSPVFAAMFQKGMTEEETGIVNVPDCDPDSFEDFLLYLYTGKMEDVSFKDAYHLYITADKYDVQELKSFCVVYMAQNLTVQNVCDVIILADLYDNHDLMHSAQRFFNFNISEIFLTDEWETMLKNNYRLANKLLKDIASNFKISLIEQKKS